jgi:hypothetical protein
MWHPFPGFSGSVVSLAVFVTAWRICRSTKKHPFYNLGPGGDPHDYEPLLNRYVRLAEFSIGIATGSIVLVVGSSALHGNGGRLAWSTARRCKNAGEYIWGCTSANRYWTPPRRQKAGAPSLDTFNHAAV